MVGVAVVALVVSGLVVVLTRKSGSVTPSRTAAVTTAVTTAASSTAGSTSATSATGDPTTSTSPTSSSSSTLDNLNLCIAPDASTDLIRLTVTLSYITSYATASKFNRDVLDSCVTPAALKEIGPYYGKTFGLPGGDLTGSNGNGPTARYSVQLTNTTDYVTFTLNRKVGTVGYQIVSLTAS